MKGFRYTFFGFLGFLLVTGFNISLGILVYSTIKDKSDVLVAMLILIIILLSAALCAALDYVRRKIMIERPLKEILNATDMMSRGDFRVKLIPNHSYKDYNEFDLIKEDLNRMASELSKSELLKNDFISNVSHEIKTPLAVIQSYARYLENDDLSTDDRKKYLKSLRDSCNKLSNLVSNILKLNKLENQKLLPEISCFNLSELLADQILQFEELIDSKNIALECEIDDDLYISSEQSYLEIIFNNLISNAIKFTDSNGIIRISLNKVNDEYTMIFKDSGCGMDEETGKHIFDKFYQGDTSHSKEGNGLGLALVKRVIDIIGGSISVDSEIGVGTTFIVKIRSNDY